jgi:hypothetical protein
VDVRNSLPDRDREESDDLARQEFILLSDTLGVSMLLDAINHRSATGATDTTVYGLVSYPVSNDGPAGRMPNATARHPWRPAHLHFMIEAPSQRTLVTHLFDKEDRYLQSDAGWASNRR